jgi:hypothetical protein
MRGRRTPIRNEDGIRAGCGWRTLFWGGGLVVLLLPVLSEPVRGLDISYSGSLQFGAGDYFFDESTLSIYFYNGLSVSSGPLRIYGSVPVIMQSAPWASYSGAGILPTGGMQHGEIARRRNRETMSLSHASEPHDITLGDPLSRVELRVMEEEGMWPSLSVGADIKFPLAAIDRGFGTGAWDFGGGVSASKAVGNRLLFLDLSYWRLGDLPDLELRDTLSYRVAVGQPLAGGRVALMASLSGSGAVIEGVEPPLQAGFGVSRLLEPGRSIDLSAGFGLSESSPDFWVSLGWTAGLGSGPATGAGW